MPRVYCLIIAPLVEERDALAAYLPELRQISGGEAGDGRRYEEAILEVSGNHRIVVMTLSDQGRPSAASATTAAILKWKPELVVLTGIAGGVGGRGVRLGDVLVATQVVDYERQRIQADKREIRPRLYPTDIVLQRTATECGGRDWQSEIKVENPSAYVPTWNACQIASGDKFVADANFLMEVCPQFPELRGLEMEAGGVAVACAESVSRPRFLVVRAVSDLADARKRKMDFGERKAWRTFACHAAAAFAVAVIRRQAELDPSPAENEAASSASFGIPREDACLLGAAPWRSGCCRCRNMARDQYVRRPAMSELVLHLAKLCRTRAALTFATAVVLVSAVAIYVLLGHHRAGVVGSCLLGSFGAALGALSIGCTMSVAYGLGLKGQITEGIVSKVALDRFLAVVDGIVYRPSLFRRIFRREK